MSGNKNLILFPKDNISFVEKFYLLMDLLVSNQHSSQTEAFLLFGIYYIQLISGFFSENIGVFNIEESTSDKLLNYLYKIFRLKDFLKNSYSDYQIIIYILISVYAVFTIYFLIKILKIEKGTFYSVNESILNYGIKVFIYILFNISLDMTLSNFCFVEGSQANPNFSDIPCSVNPNTATTVICIVSLIYIIFCLFFIQIFYNDSLYLSNSSYAKISCNYETYMGLNAIVYSAFLIHVSALSKEVFLIYNLIASALFVNFYFRRFLFYDRITNILCGLFHILYLWTSLFFLIFAYVNFNEKGIIYFVSSLIVLYFYFNLKYKIEENILLATPFYKITNKCYLLYYIKNIIDKINNMTNSPEEKALLTGIVQMHAIECPNPDCLSKTKKKIYLPMSNEWSDRSKPLINDQVFLFNFVIVIMNFFIEQNYYSPDMIINMSLYYLEIIGNYCQSLFFYKKVKEMKLSHQEKFSFKRLHIAISKSLISKLKAANEPCSNLEDLNMTFYFKYTDLSQKLFDEMSHDVNFLLEFWKSFKGSQVDSSKAIDFNKIFHLTDKIRITKAKVELIWKKLFDIYNGVNDLFDLYLNYTEQINDDDLLKRDFDEIKRKTENSTEFIQQNYYNILFNKETGIIIANGDKGKEGIIEKANYSIEEIFKYKAEELKGLSVNQLMPRLIAKDHKRFMENYCEYGEKKIIDNKEMKTFGKEKTNSLIMIRVGVKLFPMINESVFFGSLMIRENIDDMILIDSKFIIQGMSSKLMKILQIDNNSLFNDNDIPFYVICKKFVNFYKIFLKKKNNSKEKSKIQMTSDIDEINISTTTIQNNNNNTNTRTNIPNSNFNGNEFATKKDKEEDRNDDDSPENIEINENIELEYEIRVPQYIYDYSNYQNKREKKIEMDGTNKDTESISSNMNMSMNEEMEEYAESDLLVGNEDITAQSPQTKKETPNKNAAAFKKEVTQQSRDDKVKVGNDNNLNEFKHQADEEKEFIHQIQTAKDLFDNSQFNELEELIDEMNKDNNINEYKFNFTFDKYKYGDKQNGYLVRCIDNKIEGNRSDDESLGEENDPKIAKFRKEKNESMKVPYEIMEDERITLVNNYQNFIQYSLEDKAFQKVLIENKETIYKLSMVHGHKKEEISEDENSSQSSQSGFNADLCKKNHIEEIRANIMKNVSNFYTLKYIKLILTGMFATTAVFMSCFIVFTFQTYNHLNNVAFINNELYQTTVWMSDLQATLISIRTIYEVRKNKEPFLFSTFIENEDAYFIQMKEVYGQKWYNNIVDSFSVIESNIGKFIFDSVNTFWNNEMVQSVVSFNDEEAFPLLVGQVLSDINSLLTNANFTNNKDVLSKLTANQISFFEYSGILAIENAVTNLLPSQYNKIKTLPLELKSYNSKLLNNIVILVAINFVLIFIFNVGYTVLLYLTNQNMGEGLEKVAKIRLEKIEDTIKRIEGFNVILKKYQDKGSKGLQNSENTGDKNFNDTVLENSNKQNSTNSNGFSSELKKHKKLSILNHSYLHTLIIFIIECAFIIPLYFITYQMVDSTNQMINVHGYMFGKIIIAAASSVSVKCMMSQCKNETALEYASLVNKSDIQSIVQGISIFPELSDFYNNKFLLNACDSAFDKVLNNTQYNECMSDVLIQSANNTDSLLRLVEETVDNIIKEKEMKDGKDVIYPDNSEKPFSTLLLYNTTAFYELEAVFYKYIAPVSDNFSIIAQKSLNNYLQTKFIIICVLSAILAILILVISGYLGVFFVKQLIHLLSVSRCILKIIPTIVITNTPDLENWIENKY